MSNHAMKGLALLTAFGLAACGAEEEQTQAQAASQAGERTRVQQQRAPSPLEAEVRTRSLGEVAIKGGLVETEFVIENADDAPATLAAAYTSCMCTEVTLEFGDGTRMGPFGMPGHDLRVTLERTLEPGERFAARATFDPMAHGPDAVGPVERVIALHTDNGGVLQLGFTANVVKEDQDRSGP